MYASGLYSAGRTRHGLTLLRGHYKIPLQMTGLSHNHKRRILTSLQYADKQLDASLHSLAPSSQPLFSGYIQDLSPARARYVECYAEKIRRQMTRLLEKCDIEVPSPSTSAMGRVRTSLTSLDLTLEDIHPEKLRGYGKIDPAAARELSWTLQETRGLVSRLLALLSQPSAMDADGLDPLENEPAMKTLFEHTTRIITDRGLVEFLPALNAILRTAQTWRFEVAVLGKSKSGKSSVINLLLDTDLMPAGVAPAAVLPIRIDSGLAPRLRVTFLDHVEELPVERIAEFATEAGNPANSKRVVALEVLVAARRLQEGLAFIETPDIGPITGGAPGFVAGYLPDADLALVLVDAQSSIGREDLNLLRALSLARVRSVVMISKCDLLSPQDVERVQAQVRQTIAAELDFTPEVIPIGSSRPLTAALNAWFEKAVSPLLAQSRADLSEFVARQGRSLCKSILVTLEIEQSHTQAKAGIPDRAEPILRRLDESLDAFQHRWDHEIDAMSGWEKAILDRAAADMTATRAPSDQPGIAGGSSVAQAVMVAIASQCSLFLQEFQELRAQIQAGMAELVRQTNAGGIPVHELPKPSALPLPLAAPLHGISITTSGSRHFRKELDEKVGARLRQILEAIQPRFRYWFIATMGALRESFRMQTDPLRYRNPAGSSSGSDDRLAADIDFLRKQ